MNPRDDDRTIGNVVEHEEWLTDEAIRGSFPASDPASSSEPGSIVNLRYAEATANRLASRMPALAAGLLVLTLAWPGSNAFAQDAAAYRERTITRFEQQFASLDLDRNAEVTRAEAHGDIDFTAAFDDIDINRDGIVTKAELDRFLALSYGATGNK